jgi:hypothetical protein
MGLLYLTAYDSTVREADFSWVWLDISATLARTWLWGGGGGRSGAAAPGGRVMGVKKWVAK